MTLKSKRVTYNPKTKQLPGTNQKLLARAQALLSRRGVGTRSKAELQPRGTFKLTNLWDNYSFRTATPSSTSFSLQSDSSRTSYQTDPQLTVPKSSPKKPTKSFRVKQAVYQKELRKRREQAGRGESHISRSTTTSSKRERSASDDDKMLRSVRKEIAATKLGTQARHNAYHGNANPGKQLDLPIVQKRRRISYASDDETPSLARKRKKSHEDIGSKILLSKRQLLAEEANCHYCQLASFSIYEGYPVTVENNVDDSTFPPNFRFIEKQILGKGVERVDPGFHSGCECSNGYCESGNCQCHNPFDDEESEHSNGSIPNRQLPYVMTGVKKGCLRTNLLNSRDVLWECHEACQCGPKCPNRIVANGRQIPLTIFRTADRGWGVKSTVDVRSGQFIDCYFGEILTLETANKRRDSLDRSNNKDIYLFGLDKFYDEKSEVPAENTLYEVDGALFGGPTRFINHSCKPNLRIFARVGSVVEKNLHDLAFFAIRDIKAGDELLFDYVDGKENSEIFDGKTKEEIAEITKTMTKCLCGSRDECRKFLWG